MGAQVPLGRPVSAFAQDMHVPAQALLQQMPPAQVPDWQSPPPPHGPPSAVLHSVLPSATYRPSLSHVWWTVPMHMPAPGTQLPVHSPLFRHTEEQTAWEIQRPVASHC
jgi:hypothetical protein